MAAWRRRENPADWLLHHATPGWLARHAAAVDWQTVREGSSPKYARPGWQRHRAGRRVGRCVPGFPARRWQIPSAPCGSHSLRGSRHSNQTSSPRRLKCAHAPGRWLSPERIPFPQAVNPARGSFPAEIRPAGDRVGQSRASGSRRRCQLLPRPGGQTAGWVPPDR